MKRLLTAFIILPALAMGQINLNPYPHATEMVRDHLLSGDIKVYNVKYFGDYKARALFVNKGTILPIKEVIVISTGEVEAINRLNQNGGTSGVNDTPGDPALNEIVNGVTYDAGRLSFEFVPTDSIISFEYVFASEEYPEYVFSPFNDVFAFFLTDIKRSTTKNLATIPGSRLPINVNNINDRRFPEFYIENYPIRTFEKSLTDSIKRSFEFDGCTKTLVAYSQVRPGDPYRIIITIADVSDAVYDSAVFLKGGSFKSQSIQSFNSQYKAVIQYFEESELAEKEPESITPKNSETSNENAHKTSQDKTDSLVVHFDFDEYQHFENEVNIALSTLKGHSQTLTIKSITGHTDSKGTTQYNLDLGMRRAEYIKSALNTTELDMYEVPVRSKGESSPISTNNSDEGRAANRRAVILYTY
jgi:outer membrane protein OmpA-like peptidoglycan-associated protein